MEAWPWAYGPRAHRLTWLRTPPILSGTCRPPSKLHRARRRPASSRRLRAERRQRRLCGGDVRAVPPRSVIGRGRVACALRIRPAARIAAPGSRRARCPAGWERRNIVVRPAEQAEEQAAEPSQAPALPGGATPIKGPAARLAQNMAASLSVPTATSFRDVPVAALEERRRALNAQVAPKKVSFTHLIGWAHRAGGVRAARHDPLLPGGRRRRPPRRSRRRQPGPGGGRRTAPMAAASWSCRSSRPRMAWTSPSSTPATRSWSRGRAATSLSPDDMAGATITLTNPGTLGTTASVPRLMPGQGTIVATGAIRDTGAGRVMTITSTYDHRVIQGAESGAFLRRIDGAAGRRRRASTRPLRDLGAERGAPPVAAACRTGSGRCRRQLRRRPEGTWRPAVALVRAYRSFGHLRRPARPAGQPAARRPGPRPRAAGPHPRDRWRASPPTCCGSTCPGATLAEALPALRATYCGSIAYEVEHIASHEERVWLRRVIESGEHRRAAGRGRAAAPARAADRRWKGSSASCIGPTWARSGSASRGWT